MECLHACGMVPLVQALLYIFNKLLLECFEILHSSLFGQSNTKCSTVSVATPHSLHFSESAACTNKQNMDSDIMITSIIVEPPTP